jgi:hypothetical protein
MVLEVWYRIQVGGIVQFIWKNIAVWIRRWPPKLGASYCVRENDSLNVVVGKSLGDTDPTKKTDHRGIDFIYHALYLDIFVRCSEFIVGGIEWIPTESLEAQLLNSEIIGDNGTSVFRIISTSINDVNAMSVYGPDKGILRVFDAEEVSRYMKNNFTS